MNRSRIRAFAQELFRRTRRFFSKRNGTPFSATSSENDFRAGSGRVPAVLVIALAVFPLPVATLIAQEADLLVPEEFSSPEPLRLKPDHEERAEGTARYLEALFEEESAGPDRALDAKRKVLALDPGFTGLAMEVARQYLRIGETSEAISVLKDSAKASPKKSDPLVALAGIYLRQLRKPDLAEKYGTQALLAAPDESAPYQILFEIYKSTFQNQKIEGLFTRAAKRNPPSADFWLDLVELRLRDLGRQGKDVSKIVEMLDRAQEFAGDRAETLVRVGNGFVLCDQPGRAIPLYQLALTLRPNMEGVRDKLAMLLLQAGETTEAIKVIEDMVRENPLNFRAYDQLAELYLRTDEQSKALASLKQAILVAPPDPRRFSNLIQLSLHSGDAGAAVLFAEEAEKTFPKLIEFTFFKALALSGARKHAEAIKAFERILVEAGISRPEMLDGDFYFSYGVSAEQAGRFAKAAEALKKSIELDPANAARACNYLGYMWADRNENLQEAEALVLRAVAVEPENGAYLDSLGWVYFRKGLHAQALDKLLHAAELLKTDDAVVFDHIGDVCEKLGKTAEAVAYWRKALQLDAKNESIAAKLDACSAKVAQKPAPAQKAP
ncbi:MAG: tetratricopeptide repeat protein [Terrimicrobiaceae bacterium]|jgi:tetratricopeptide (TPR) repeat protein|nr:tetratricopeptide repeat protein [Terrimicrobiaceae bacterium]